MEVHLKICGFILIGLALLHIVIPRYFKWKSELVSITLITRQIFYVHTFFIAMIVFLMGCLCLSSTNDLLTTPIGETINLGLFIFWFTRLIFQFLVYSPLIWRGKKFETIIHIIFSILWFYLSSVFLISYLY
jgi:hypothetical protein